MAARVGYPAGVPCWIDLSPPDPAAAVAFYGGLFGWALENRVPPGAPGEYHVATLDGRTVAAIGSPPGDGPGGQGGPPAWLTYVRVDSADDTAARVAAAGGEVLSAPDDVGPPGRSATCADPAGAVFALWQPGTNTGAEVVNAPGTWNWSDLGTPDPAGARAFYGDVFGWTAVAVDMGGADASMWQLPGYGDFLAEAEPGIRERQAGAGVPAGFEDAIGWLLPAEPGAAPRWDVTFAVSDTDATARRADDLGGSVVVAPYDAGPARIAVLADPQGATFSVSRYDPG